MSKIAFFYKLAKRGPSQRWGGTRGAALEMILLQVYGKRSDVLSLCSRLSLEGGVRQIPQWGHDHITSHSHCSQGEALQRSSLCHHATPPGKEQKAKGDRSKFEIIEQHMTVPQNSLSLRKRLTASEPVNLKELEMAEMKRVRTCCLEASMRTEDINKGLGGDRDQQQRPSGRKAVCWRPGQAPCAKMPESHWIELWQEG